MKRIDLTARARLDLLSLWEYIANDSVDAADRVIDEIFRTFEKLADTPGMGHVRDDVKDVRYR